MSITILMSDLPAATAALSAEDRQDLFNAIKNKLQDLAGDHEDLAEKLSINVKKRVDVLKEIQSQHDELEAKFFEERAALEAKYQKLYEPLYLKRYEIINGVTEVGEVSLESTENKDTDESKVGNLLSVEKGVPHFWLTAMKNNDVLSQEITERDEDALKYLKDVKWSNLDDSKGFKIEFFFGSNPYFKNTVLVKAYYMISENEHILEKATGTKIEWFTEKNLTKKILKKKLKKGSTDSKPVMKIEDCVSFFNFFDPPEIPEDESEIDDETIELLQSEMEQDYNVGSTIREKIIPHAVSWFTGEAIEDEDEEDDDDDDDDEEDDEDSDNEEEEEDLENEKGVKKVE